MRRRDFPGLPKPCSAERKSSGECGGAPTARFFRTGLHFFQKTLDLRAALWYNTECCHLGVAQLVARYLGVVEAASSSLVTQTNVTKPYEPTSVRLFASYSE